MVKKVLGPSGWNPKEDPAIYREYYASFSTPLESLFEYIEETLSCFRDHRFDLGICFNKPQRLCKKVLEETNLARLFSEVLGGDVLPKNQTTCQSPACSYRFSERKNRKNSLYSRQRNGLAACAQCIGLFCLCFS